MVDYRGGEVENRDASPSGRHLQREEGATALVLHYVHDHGQAVAELGLACHFPRNAPDDPVGRRLIFAVSGSVPLPGRERRRRAVAVERMLGGRAGRVEIFAFAPDFPSVVQGWKFNFGI